MHQFDLTLEARISERTGIARELHDTLLQSFQGALLRFQSVANVVTTRPDEARERLERALDQAEAAITEGRDAVQGLRSRLRRGMTWPMGSRRSAPNSAAIGQPSPPRDRGGSRRRLT